MFLYARTSRVTKHRATQKPVSAIHRSSNSLIKLILKTIHKQSLTGLKGAYFS